ncbi:MAG: hypothetical protein GF383_11985 [Candidatus Lokiarchaeota archaeon]|nr:hypothetical protein [Candidatus Lokiarchaeota archaeon]MBD3341600.1 hypothetical protein [Candidatus Lokiarchaeota archaeon]
MSDWYEEPYFFSIIVGIAMIVGGLLFMFFVYPTFFSEIAFLFIINIIGIIAGAVFLVIGIVLAILD